MGDIPIRQIVRSGVFQSGVCLGPFFIHGGRCRAVFLPGRCLLLHGAGRAQFSGQFLGFLFFPIFRSPGFSVLRVFLLVLIALFGGGIGFRVLFALVGFPVGRFVVGLLVPRLFLIVGLVLLPGRAAFSVLLSFLGLIIGLFLFLLFQGLGHSHHQQVM